MRNYWLEKIEDKAIEKELAEKCPALFGTDEHEWLHYMILEGTYEEETDSK